MQGLFSLRAPMEHIGRLPTWRRQANDVSLGEWVALLASGVLCGTMLVFLPWSIRLPGSAILRAVFPMTLGVSLVPRPGAGTTIGGVAGSIVGTAWWYGIGSGHLSTLTTVLALGLFLDLALRTAQSGRSLYLRIALAGAAANLLSFGVRWTTAYLNIEPSGQNSWPWTAKLASFLLCGFIAGAISAAVWIRFSNSANSNRE